MNDLTFAQEECRAVDRAFHYARNIDNTLRLLPWREHLRRVDAWLEKTLYSFKGACR